MNLIDLESFVVVADAGSIVAAASRLHITQSAVTRRIQNLEQALGAELFDRNTRPLELTAAGRETYEFARPVLGSVRNLRQAVAHDGEPSGEFRFGIPRGLGDMVLVEPVTALRDQFSKVRLRAFVHYSDVLLERLSDLELDATVVLLPEGISPPSGFAAEGMGEHELRVVSAKGRRFAPHTKLADLAAESWILNPPGGGTRQLMELALMEKRLPFQLAVEAEGHDLQLALIAEGVGLGLATRQLLATSPLRKRLSILTVQDFHPKLMMWLLYRQNIGRLLPVVHLLRDRLKDSMKRGKTLHGSQASKS